MQTKLLDSFEVKSFEVKSSKLLEGEIRFNADYFLTSDNITYHKNIKFTDLSEFAKVIFPGIFKRMLVDDPQFGVPFITTSGMMEYSPEPEKYLSTLLTTNLNIYQVEEDWILVSRSGTIGNTVFTSKNLTRFAVTEDALRVIPYDKNKTGFLYFFITSNYGRDSIVGKKGGAVVDHIYEEDLQKLKVPLIPDAIIATLQQKYLAVKSLREEASGLLNEANKLVYQHNNLPPLKIADAEYFDKEKLIQSRVLNSSLISGEYRLDAHFYNPVAELAIRNIMSNSLSNLLLNELATPTYMGGRASRNYVEKGFGVQFLSGKNIVQIRPTDPKYLSKQETVNLEELLLQKGWILITRSGTLGRTVLIWNNYEKVAASEHLIRVIPKNNEIDSGYLFAFLSSDYGYHQLVKFKHGAVIDEITEDQIGETVIPIPKSPQRKIIGDKVRLAYEKRAEAIHLEDKAQEILKQSLAG